MFWMNVYSTLGRTHSDGINLPKWNQVRRAHQQTKHGVACASDLHTARCARFFKTSEQNTIHKTVLYNQERASVCAHLFGDNTFRLDADLHVFMGKTSVRPDALLHFREHFGLEDIRFRGNGRGKGKTRPKGGSVHQKKVVSRCFDCNRFGHWSGDPICPVKDKHDAQVHITSCTLMQTVRCDC